MSEVLDALQGAVARAAEVAGPSVVGLGRGWGRGSGVAGEPVVALADPGGRGLRVSLGFVTATGLPLPTPGRRGAARGIEHGAPLPRGSSGSPLVDPDGRLLGLNAVRREGGLILALSAGADLRRRADALAPGTQPSRPRLGIAIAPPHLARRLRAAVGLPEREGLLVR